MMILDQRTKYFNEAAANNLRKSIARYELGGMIRSLGQTSHSDLILQEAVRTSPGGLDHTYSTLYGCCESQSGTSVTDVIESPEVISAYAEAMSAINPQILETSLTIARYLNARKNIDAVMQVRRGGQIARALKIYSSAGVDANLKTLHMLRRAGAPMLAEAGCRRMLRLYFKVTTLLYDFGRTSASATHGVMNMAREKYTEAEKYYTEAIGLESDPLTKSSLLAKLATLELTSEQQAGRTRFCRRKQPIRSIMAKMAMHSPSIAEVMCTVCCASENRSTTGAVYWVVADYLIREHVTPTPV
ncbi:MAG: hypothetical protein MZV63_55350 [Marinilabiliales bacterium]|nr:hypothetical protein [Marinilabiliales bacterium]